MPYGTLNTDSIASSTGNLAVTGNVVPTGGIFASNAPGVNRIINGAMAIDQRNAGAAQTITAAAALAYTVDRWYAYCTGANVTGQRVAGSGGNLFAYRFTGASSVTAIGFGQRIEAANSADLAGTTATLSVELANTLLTTVTWTAFYATTTDTFGTLASPTRTQIATGTFTVTSTLTRYNAQISIPAAATTGIEIVFTVGAQTSGTWTIDNVQLEAGSMMSVFERRLITAEQLLCYRYFYRAFDYQNTGGAAATTARIQVRTPFKVSMRTAPTVAVSGSWAVSDDYASDIIASSITLLSSQVSADGGRVFLDGFSGLTMGRWYGSSGNTGFIGSGSITYSSEL